MCVLHGRCLMQTVVLQIGAPMEMNCAFWVKSTKIGTDVAFHILNIFGYGAKIFPLQKSNVAAKFKMAAIVIY